MKKSILEKTLLTAAVTIFTVGVIFTSCTSPAKKVENAENNVAEANKDLEKANQEYQADVSRYRKETADRIATNNQSIVAFNKRIAHEKKLAKADYKKKIALLERKNSDMKKKMDDYKADGKENWNKFKAEFTHDMDELGTAFKDLTVKNVR